MRAVSYILAPLVQTKLCMQVQTILVNIFGGIMRCDTIAKGVVAAAQKIGLRKPVILRLQGTNVKEAKAFIEESGFKIIMIDGV